MHHNSTLLAGAKKWVAKDWIQRAEFSYGGVCLLGGIGMYLAEQERNAPRVGKHAVFKERRFRHQRAAKEGVKYLNRAIRRLFFFRWLFCATIGFVCQWDYGWKGTIVAAFNDSPFTRKQDVLKVLDKAIELAMKDESKETAKALKRVHSEEVILSKEAHGTRGNQPSPSQPDRQQENSPLG